MTDSFSIALSTMVDANGDCQLTTALGIPESHPVLLDANIPYPDECLFLLFQVLGQCSFQGTEFRSEMFLTFHRTGARLESFLESFIGCAVTHWCLNTDLNEEIHYSTVSGGEIKRTFEKCKCMYLYWETDTRS